MELFWKAANRNFLKKFRATSGNVSTNSESCYYSKGNRAYTSSFHKLLEIQKHFFVQLLRMYNIRISIYSGSYKKYGKLKWRGLSLSRALPNVLYHFWTILQACRVPVPLILEWWDNNKHGWNNAQTIDAEDNYSDGIFRSLKGKTINSCIYCHFIVLSRFSNEEKNWVFFHPPQPIRHY